MSERLTHRRTKGPASTPATRLVELQNELSHTQRLLAEANAEVTRLRADHDIYHRVGDVSFGGIEIAQYRCEFTLWEQLLNANHQIRAVFELGTWMGGFSWWLWAQTKIRRQEFYSYDAVVPERPPPTGFIHADVFAKVEEISSAMRVFEPCIVFCDNGNKPRELQTFAAELRHPDSLLVAHDWLTEIGPDDVPDIVEMMHEDLCVQLGSMSRVFRLKGESDA